MTVALFDPRMEGPPAGERQGLGCRKKRVPASPFANSSATVRFLDALEKEGRGQEGGGWGKGAPPGTNYPFDSTPPPKAGGGRKTAPWRMNLTHITRTN